MQTCFRCSARLAIVFALLLAPCALTAQTLAHPGWKGSGLAAEAWWRNAVFYRIDVTQFQDSNGDGTGDLTGISQRLDYLQALGVDAIVLQMPQDSQSFDETGFDTLQHEASTRHIRLVMELSASGTNDLLAGARAWLARGAAGIYLRIGTPSATSPSADLLRSLRSLTQSMPGERVLMAGPDAGGGVASQSDAAQLVDVLLDAAPSQLVAALTRTLSSSEAALYSAAPPSQPSPDRTMTSARGKLAAALLLTVRGAVLLNYGQELGLEGASPTMQWTPSNVTAPKVEEAAPPEAAAKPAKPAPSQQPAREGYGAFVPYKPPPRIVVKSAAELEKEAIEAMPGFSTHKTAATATPGFNVAVEDAAPGSLLNFYRRMVQLHHANSSLRSGTPYVLDRSENHAAVLLRRAPAGARTAATVVVAFNLDDKPVTLSLNTDFARLHMHSGSLRPLAASWSATPQSQPSGHIALPAYGVYIAELYH